MSETFNFVTDSVTGVCLLTGGRSGGRLQTRDMVGGGGGIGIRAGFRMTCGTAPILKQLLTNQRTPLIASGLKTPYVPDSFDFIVPQLRLPTLMKRSCKCL